MLHRRVAIVFLVLVGASCVSAKAIGYSRVSITFPVAASVPGAAVAQLTERVSVDSKGRQGRCGGSVGYCGLSYDGSISGDGRFVAFGSSAFTLVLGDTNGEPDVFVHDRQTGNTTRVSVDSTGVEANDSSGAPSVSDDGRFVAFLSGATNLVPGDTNGRHDVFVHDRQTGSTTRVSVDSAGVEANDDSYELSISGDGRFVAFTSEATNLVPGDTNGRWDVFVHDLESRTTTRVSVDSGGLEANSHSVRPSVSANGRFVAFDSPASNLVPGDANKVQDVFVHDRESGATTRVSIDSTGIEANKDSIDSSISGDGRYVSFLSWADNLVPGDTNRHTDAFVHDRETGTTTRVSVDSAGAEGNGGVDDPSISGDGRVVTFIGSASNLVPGDTNGHPDAFVHDRQSGKTIRVSVDSTGVQADDDSRAPSISGDGRFVTFMSEATNLVAGDTNGEFDVFVHGSYLTLEATPEIVISKVSRREHLKFTTWRGQAGAPALLAAVDVNGTPLFQAIQFGACDDHGLWAVSYRVPTGLSGNEITFQAFAFATTGTLETTNREVVAFK